MKKAIWTVLIVLLAVSCGGKKEAGTASKGENVTANSRGGSTATVKAGTPAPASDFILELSQGGGGVLITDYKGNAKILTIPATIEDLPVESVYISSSNPNVEQVFVPEGVKGIRFSGLSNLRAVSLPNTLVSIRANAFNGCTNLKSVSIPSSVTFIGQDAFKGSGIQSIVIPASVETIDNTAFYDCKSLTSAEISGSNLALGFLLFGGCDNLKTVIINEGIIRIGETFRNLKLLETVKLPDSLKTISEKAFYACESLRSIVIPKGVTEIGPEAFAQSGLTEVTISKTDEPIKIRYGAFMICADLVTVNFEEGVWIDFRETQHFSRCPKLSLKSQAAIRALGGGL